MRDKNEKSEFWLFVLEVVEFLILGWIVYLMIRWYIRVG